MRLLYQAGQLMSVTDRGQSTLAFPSSETNLERFIRLTARRRWYVRNPRCF